MYYITYLFFYYSIFKWLYLNPSKLILNNNIIFFINAYVSNYLFYCVV